MIKKIRLVSFFLISLFKQSYAQVPNDHLRNVEKPVHKIGIFAPLYLDSAFNGMKYKYYSQFPRFVLPGLSFVQGAQLALNKINLSNCDIEASIFDTKSDSLPINQLIENGNLDSLELIIGSIKDAELTGLAAFAKNKNIPLVSATFPNDGGITNCQNLIILNGTLKTHCESIFSYLLQNCNTDNIILVKQTGSQEERVYNYFNTINKTDGKQLLKIKTLTLDSNFYLIKNSLDSNRKNIVIGGSLDENFALQLASTLAGYKKKYKINLIGMPNWEGFGSLGKNLSAALKDFPIYYTNSYFLDKSDSTSIEIEASYRSLYKGNPSDLVYKGFEIVYLFCDLLNSYPTDALKHLNDLDQMIFTKFNFMPVKLNKYSATADYIENKHLYFLKKINGRVSIAWE